MKKLILPSKISAIICIDYPHQLLPALTALQDQQATHEPALLFIKYQRGSKTEGGLSLIKRMLGDFPQISLFKAKPWMCSSHLPVKLRAFFLSSILNLPIKKIFFAHDVSSDFTAQLLMQTFPQAQRICYGDALGLVYSRPYFKKLMYQNSRSFSPFLFLSALQRQFILPRPSQCYNADLAILAIPCDPGKDFMRACPLRVPKKEALINVAERIKKSLPDFSEYLHSVKCQSRYPLTIFVTSNLTESKLTIRKNEIALYLNIIQKEVIPPARILIKPHPGSEKETVEELKKSLAPEYEILIFDEKYNALPIELASEIFGETKILSISYSSISIPYLYQQPVIHALNDNLIEQYIFPEKQNWFKSSNGLYLSMIACLKTWDGHSLLQVKIDHE